MVDEQNGIGSTDYTTNVKRYLFDTINGFYVLNGVFPNASFGFAFSNMSGSRFHDFVLC